MSIGFGTQSQQQTENAGIYGPLDAITQQLTAASSPEATKALVQAIFNQGATSLIPQVTGQAVNRGARASDSSFQALAVNDIMSRLAGEAAKAVQGQQKLASDAASNLAQSTRTGQSTGSSMNMACYITTAICKAEHKPDNCKELTLLRNFRDYILAKSEAGDALIKLYYLTAPIITQGIAGKKGQDAFYRELNAKYLIPCMKAIKAGEHVAALGIYMQMCSAAANFAFSCKE